MRTRTRRISLTVLLSIFLCCLIGLIAVDRAFAAASSSEDVYVELYSPLNGKTPMTSDSDYLTANVEDTDLTESGKGLKLSYTAGASYAVTATIPFTVEKNDGFEGYALWLDVPATADAYTFSLYVQQGDAWHDMSAGNPLCLVGTDKSYEIKMSGWKRLQLNGFRGWLLMPKTCYRDPLPVRTTNMVVQFEAETDAKRSSDIDITVGTVGYYTNLKAFLYEYADPEAVDNDIRAQIDGYILKANALKPETDYQKKLRGKMLVYYSNLKEHFDELTTDEKTEVEGGLYATYCEYMEEYRFAEIKQTRFIMSFGIISDTHITNYNNTSYLEGAMRDMLKLDPDLAAMFHLGDMSDSGVSSQGEANTDLDNYYDYIAAHKPTNSRGEEIPVINVMGNHDVRGPQSEGYPSASYPLAVEMYLAREGVDSLCFDRWINGYHFIMLNTSEWGKDDCTFTAENIEWLDEKLSENEDGRPIFVMIHQPLSRIHTKSDARLTFEEVIAKHPSAIVSHGHTHYGFGNNPIVQEGKGTYINIPSLTWNSDGTCPTSEYYFVEVYEGGVVYRAREYSTDSWYVDSDAAVKALNYSDNPLFDAKGFDSSSIEGENVTAASSSEKLSLTSDAADGFAVIAAPAAGEQTRYAGYALLMETDRAVKVAFNGAAMKSDGVYYTVAEGRLVTHTAVNGALPSADGWVLIPAESFSGEAFPGKDGSFRLTFTAAGQTAAIYKASYYFDAEDFCWAVSNLTYVFYADGVVYASGTALYGEETHIPAVPRKSEDAQYRYTFAGWDVDGDGEADDLPKTLLADLSATAVFAKEIKEYTYTFIDPRAEAEGKNPVVKTETAVYGTEIAAPELADLLGWDLDEDGAAETLPAFLTCDFTASAIYKNTVSNEYENAVKVFEAGSSAISISHSGASAESLTSHTNTAVVNEKSPTGYAARFQYNAVASDGRTHAQVNASTFLWMDVSTELEGAYTYEEFGGWAIWIDVPYTEETYYGGLRVNNNRVGSACADGFTTVDNTAQVKTYASKWVSESMLPDFGNAFTGWLIVKKEALYESTALPKATTSIGIQIKPTGRVTPFTMDIGQIMVWTDYDALVEELVSKTQQTLAGKKSYLFKDADGYVYKAGEAAANERIVVPADPVGNKGYIFTGWDLDNDGYPDELPENGLIEKPLVAVAVFKNSDQCETLFKPGTGGWTKNSQKDGTTTNGLDYMTAAIEENEGSPTDSALHITIDPTGGVEGNRFNAALWLYAQIPAQSDDFDGLAVWINIPDANGYCFSVALTGSKEVVLQMKDVTWVGSDGMISTTKSWQKVYRNAPFEGWLIFPRECFPGHVLNKDSNLRFWWEAGDSKNITENWNMYLGPVLGYRGSVSELTDSFKNVLYSFRDYDGTLLSCGIVKAGSSFAPPAAPTRASDGYYSYEFAGWDVDKDGVADLLPESLVLPLNATAVYTRKGVSFTYAFKDKNGETIFEKTLPYGSLVLPPFRYDPSYADETHDYIFDGWEGYEEGMLLTENCSFGVRYTILNAVTQISGVVAENKVYDGTADVRLNLEELVLTGVAENDEVSISFENAAFESADAGKGIAVIVSGIKLTGKDAYKYSLRTGSVLSLSAEITPKTITEVKGITADDKIYDGSASATLDLSGAVLEGVTDGDEVTVEAAGEFSDKNAGSDLTVTVTEIKLTGAKAGNYVLAQGLTVNGVTASILKKQIVVTADAKTVEKGSSAELTYRVEGLVGGDTLGGSLEREPGEEVGAYEIKIGTLANDNYEILFTGAVYTITEGSGSSASGEESTGGSSVKVGCGSVFGGSVQALSLTLSAAVGFAIFKKKRGDR